MKTVDHKLAILRDLSLFSRCTAKELKQVASLCDLATVPAGRVLVREGEPAAEAYVVVSGEAVVSRTGQEVARVGAGEALGEMSIIDRPVPRSATVTARTEMELLVFEPRAFATLLEQVPSVGRSVAGTLAERLRSLENTTFA